MRHLTTALVTGASSGIGAAFARALADRGTDVVVVGRREGALQQLAEELRTRSGIQVHPVVLDLAVPGAGVDLKRRLDAQGLVVDTVINCAGAGVTRPFVESTEAEIAGQVQLNITAVTDISRAFLPDLVAADRGTLVNVGSLTGYMPVPGMAVYAAAKAFVIRFTEAIAHEVRDSAVAVMVVSPGPTRTEFYSRSGTSTAGTRFQTPEDVVTATLAALDRRVPPSHLVSGRMNRLISRLAPLAPRSALLRAVTSEPASDVVEPHTDERRR